MLYIDPQPVHPNDRATGVLVVITQEAAWDRENAYITCLKNGFGG